MSIHLKQIAQRGAYNWYPKSGRLYYVRRMDNGTWRVQWVDDYNHKLELSSIYYETLGDVRAELPEIEEVMERADAT